MAVLAGIGGVAMEAKTFGREGREWEGKKG